MSEISLLTPKYKHITLIYCTDESGAAGKAMAETMRKPGIAVFLRNARAFDDIEPCDAVIVMGDVDDGVRKVIIDAYPGKGVKEQVVPIGASGPEIISPLKRNEDGDISQLEPDSRTTFKPRMKRKAAAQ